MNWILSLLKAYEERVEDFPLTMIYVTSIAVMSDLMTWLVYNCPPAFKNRIVNYHANLGSEEYRWHFLDEFFKPDSIFSVLVRTSALGQV